MVDQRPQVPRYERQNVCIFSDLVVGNMQWACLIQDIPPVEAQWPDMIGGFSSQVACT